MENLAALLQKAPEYLETGGRLAVISFQSMEDRLVKQAFRSAEQTGLLKILTKKPLTPTEAEARRQPPVPIRQAPRGGKAIVWPHERSDEVNRVAIGLPSSARQFNLRGYMTRETKIGLLVGLAFIIVIGILLSDHLTSSTEPPPSAARWRGQQCAIGRDITVRSGKPPVAQVTAPPQVTPQQQVLTRNELSPSNSPVQIDVGGPQNVPPITHVESPVQVADALRLRLPLLAQVVRPIKSQKNPPSPRRVKISTLLSQSSASAG